MGNQIENSKASRTWHEKVIQQQIEFKNKRWTDLPNGKWSNNSEKDYAHILPLASFSSVEEAQKQVFYEGIAEKILEYCKTKGIALHKDILNLNSSQSACFNLMFPLRQNYTLASRALGTLLPNLRAVTDIEFEYTSSEITEWLGEGAATPGKNCTSIDAVVWWSDNSGKKKISLLEWKYTEKGFGGCSSASRKENATKDFCRHDWSAGGVDESCYVAKPRNRKYWELLGTAGINIDVLSKGIKWGCPFRVQYYQVMRQFLFAECLRNQHPDHEVEVVLVSFKGNDSFKDEKVIIPWNKAIKGKPALRKVYADDLNQAIQGCAGADKEWCEYLRQRYFP